MNKTEGTRRGIPTARSADHVGITVPDLEAAIAFFTDHLGCELGWRIGPMSADDDWMTKALNVHPRAVGHIAMLRMGPTFNIELFQYASPDQVTTHPKNSDIGGSHLAIYVDDIDEAAEYLAAIPGVKLQLGPNTVEDGSDVDGIRFCYFLTPWGYQMELVSAPNGLKFEQTSDVRLAPPAPDWNA